jgi:D-methionine transport system ATP-binding protein
MAQISLIHVSKVFSSEGTEVEALSDINLEIEKGEIYGIIGMSGAGKSTLVRCLNFLERPTSGDVFIEGENLGQLSEKQLRNKRSSIAMIFQNFNLLMQKNVVDNVAFPLVIRGVRKREARAKASEYLKVVGLQDKERAYPAQLSGGQKQRVAIARALASDPHILLCDEATSALDPKTTGSILELLREINRKYGITIVIITHQMDVIREVCSRVAIIENGKLAENGLVADIFSHPRSRIGKQLILGSGEHTVRTEKDVFRGEKLIRVVFSENSAFEPVIANMILHIGQPVNILRADTRNVGGIAKGEMLLGVSGEKLSEITGYLTDRGLEVGEVSEDVDE